MTIEKGNLLKCSPRKFGVFSDPEIHQNACLSLEARLSLGDSFFLLDMGTGYHGKSCENSQCHKRTIPQENHHFYVVYIYIKTIPSHGWFNIISTTLVENHNGDIPSGKLTYSPYSYEK